MKKLTKLILFISVGTVLSNASLAAVNSEDDESRYNGMKRDVEASAAAVGFSDCPECELKRMTQAAINKSTAYKPNEQKPSGTGKGGTGVE